MKKLLFVFLAFTLITLTACTKEATNCRDKVVGDYTGTVQFDANPPYNININVRAGDDDKDLILTVSKPTSYTSYTILGTLDSDCTVVTIPSQLSNTGSPATAATVSGSLSYDNDNLEGFLNIDGDQVRFDCTK